MTPALAVGWCTSRATAAAVQPGFRPDGRRFIYATLYQLVADNMGLNWFSVARLGRDYLPQVLRHAPCKVPLQPIYEASPSRRPSIVQESCHGERG